MRRPVLPPALALIAAAGRGERAGGGLPKQFRPLGLGNPLALSVAAFASHPLIGAVQIVCGEGQESQVSGALKNIAAPLRRKLRGTVTGGASRQASVRAGLEAFPPAPDDAIVLIHDAARPLISEALITRAIGAAGSFGAAIPVLPAADSVKQISASGLITATLPRESLGLAQTPQAFRLGLIREAHARAAAAGRMDFTDDASICEWAGITVHSFAGETDAFKITVEADFSRAEAVLAGRRGGYETRSGFGFDVHAFTDGDHVVLCGVRIAHERGIRAHSDGDAALHALTDAILGALGDGDIGIHFPPSDARWQGAASEHFVSDALQRLRARGGRLVNLDITIVCEAPKIAPHRSAMIERLSQLTGLGPGAIGLKATTSEKLGFTGRREGIAAQAIVSLELPR